MDCEPMNTIKSIINHGSGYSLGLANGQGWYVTATQGLRLWAEKLAAIMQLKVYEPNGHPKLIFIGRKPEKDPFGETTWGLGKNIEKGLPKRGWKARDFIHCRIWSHHDVADMICEVGRGDQDLEITINRIDKTPHYHNLQVLISTADLADHVCHIAMGPDSTMHEVTGLPTPSG